MNKKPKHLDFGMGIEGDSKKPLLEQLEGMKNTGKRLMYVELAQNAVIEEAITALKEAIGKIEKEKEQQNEQTLKEK